MRPPFRLACLILLSGCEISSDTMLDESAGLLGHQALLGAANTVVHPLHSPCGITLRVELVSSGEAGLELHTTHTPSPDCDEGAPVETTVHAVERVSHDRGLKIYHARGESGQAQLWDYRNQEMAGMVPWSLLVETARPSLWGQIDWDTYFFQEVSDENLEPESPAPLRIEVVLAEPLDPPAVESLLFPLVIDMGQSHAIDSANPTDYILTVRSDLLPEHVVSQVLPVEGVLRATAL